MRKSLLCFSATIQFERFEIMNALKISQDMRKRLPVRLLQYLRLPSP